VSGERHPGGRLDLVEVIEDARLVAAEQPLRLRIANVPGMTREVDSGVEGHDGGHGFANGSLFHLISQNNIFSRKLLQTLRLILSSNCPIRAGRLAVGD
jgi:hypothetical protein